MNTEDKAETPDQFIKEAEQLASQRAAERARTARWDLNIAIFLFTILIIVIILLFQGITIEIVAPVALFGLVMAWLEGWRRGKRLYQRFYEEELSYLTSTQAKSVEETIEERVQKALRDRWR
ncbi:hypothetical protein ACFLV3_05620 [Chloroflexota bacterium]